MLSEILNSINYTKENLIKSDKISEKDYVPFVVNKCLSYFPDTIFYANRMNQLSFLDKSIQYDYYLHTISKKKRFSKWIKSEKNKDIDTVKQIYNYSNLKAEQVIDLLPIDKLNEFSQKGGQKI